VETAINVVNRVILQENVIVEVVQTLMEVEVVDMTEVVHDGETMVIDRRCAAAHHVENLVNGTIERSFMQAKPHEELLIYKNTYIF